MISEKATHIYNLMDAAYDGQLIEETSRKSGHGPITDRNGRGKEVAAMAHRALQDSILCGASEQSAEGIFRCQQCYG